MKQETPKQQEPGTDAEYQAALSQAGYEIIYHDKKFASRKFSDGTQKELKAETMSEALEEAWPEVKAEAEKAAKEAEKADKAADKTEKSEKKPW